MEDKDDREWYNAKEQVALGQATTIVALSEKDKSSLQKLLSPSEEKKIHVLLPPLRRDIESQAQQRMEHQVGHGNDLYLQQSQQLWRLTPMPS